MKTQRMNFLNALDYLLTGRYDIRSYDGYILYNKKGNLYIKHKDDKRKRLINHDELQLMMNKQWYVVGDDSTAIPWSQQLIQ
jgi:hypothetical protein